VRSQESRATALAGRLAAATGCDPRTDETPELIRLEVDLPTELTASARDGILAALVLADRYGHIRTDQGAIAWMELDLRKPS
jgi:hypothetical protein